MTEKENWEAAGGAGIVGCVVSCTAAVIALLWGYDFWAKVAGTGAIVSLAWILLVIPQITGSEAKDEDAK